MPSTSRRRVRRVAPALLTWDQAATYLGVSRRTVERRTQCGSLPVVRISPGRLGFRREDLDAYIKARVENPHTSQTA